MKLFLKPKISIKKTSLRIKLELYMVQNILRTKRVKFKIFGEMFAHKDTKFNFQNKIISNLIFNDKSVKRGISNPV